MSTKRGSANFIQRSEFASFFDSEALLQQSVAALLTRIPGVHRVQIVHGPTEHGRDIIFFSKSGLGEEILCACILKNTKISGAVDNAKGARTVLFQAQQAFDTPYIDASGREHFVERVYIMTPYDISAASTSSVLGALRRDPGRINFFSGSELYDLFAQHWPEFVAQSKPDIESASPKKTRVAKAALEPQFFVSYTSSDKDWAEWIAWTFEEAGFRTTIQAWDFVPGSNFVLEMQRALERAERIVLVLSEDYLKSQFTSAEWAAFFAQDPVGKERKLLPIRVRECRPEGLLRAIVYLDIVGLSENDARTAILGALSQRARPLAAPSFPAKGGRPRVEFPGSDGAEEIWIDFIPSLKTSTTVQQKNGDNFDPTARLVLYKHLNRLAPEHFNMLVFALKPPPGLIAPMPASQAQRSDQLLVWAEATGGCGLGTIKLLLDRLTQDD